MKSSKVIIAESGGSKTDWLLLDGNEILDSFTTCSYHPLQWSVEVEKKESWSWKERKEWMNFPLYFFGAGCYRQESANLMVSILKTIGFKQVHVKSDVHAAGYALFGDEEGWGAILGTGSVVFRWENKNIVQIIGGKGAHEGDEGSGYYFGKLLIENKAIPDSEWSELSEMLERNPTANKNCIGALAKKYGADVDFIKYHTENIVLFIERYIKPNGISKISIVGGYAANMEVHLRKVFADYGVVIENIIDKPIVRLIEQKVHFIE